MPFRFPVTLTPDAKSKVHGRKRIKGKGKGKGEGKGKGMGVGF
jgi:hypothetical protein